MLIRNMFAEDINRSINGVIKVQQDSADIIEQEVREYVITKELKKHFISFFDNYSEAFENPTDNIGVWISGFFGSGKSHFLKMLSYILENKNISGVSAVELFRRKFEDDPATFMLIDKSTRGNTETILFNIDIEGSMLKDKTAVLRVFAKMFYSHLGFFGEDLKIAMLEQYLDQLGKSEEFMRVFEQKRGKSWTELRKAFAFLGKFVVPTLMEVLDMTEEDAKRWFNDKASVDISISKLVNDIKAYVDSKPDNFRLLFMIDEVGQYIGANTDMLLNLQSLIEELGSKCRGKVWVMCTGQEAIDEIVKVRENEFSRIQARFGTRLSLSSSSVDEVIQKRILKKTPEAAAGLENLYCRNDSVLRNLFSFTDAVLDLKGYAGPAEFAVNYPFVPYQFTVMQKVFSEIRKHGNSGKHLSGGERSMLSGFQEAAQRLQERDEYTLAPFFSFYDTVHSFLDSAIRRVIERCEKAAENSDGIEPADVNVLKLLYLIRYIDDIPANIDNIVILMADNIGVDKIILREQVRGSLDRLLSQNYIGRSGENYRFLTDEEQDVAREIKNVSVAAAEIVKRISDMIFAGIYDDKKFSSGKYNFSFDKMVDDVVVGGCLSGGMKLQFLTAASDEDKDSLSLITKSEERAIIVLPDNSSYYERLESAMKIEKYVMQRNIAQLPRSMQDIISAQKRDAEQYKAAAAAELRKAIETAKYYAGGEELDIKSGDAKSRISQTLEVLVSHVYRRLGLIEKNVDSNDDIIKILKGTDNLVPGTEPNLAAAADMEEFLSLQDFQKLSTTMFDVQKKYQAAPYGWREIDIAAVAAMLIAKQKASLKYNGETVAPDNSRLPDLLRQKTEIAKSVISKRKTASADTVRRIKELLREYFDIMDVPDDDDGLAAFIVEKFERQIKHYEDLNAKYDSGRYYPGRTKVLDAIRLTTEVFSQRKDNIALFERLLARQDELLDSKEVLQEVEDFFKTKAQIFDEAVRLESELRSDREYLASSEPEASKALGEINSMVAEMSSFKYRRVPELSDLMAKVRKGHGRLLEVMRKEENDVAAQCMEAIRQAVEEHAEAKTVIAEAERYYADKSQEIEGLQKLALLASLSSQMVSYKDRAVEKLERLSAAPAPSEQPVSSAGEGDSSVKISETPQPEKNVKSYRRQVFFPISRLLESEADIDAYVEVIRKKLKHELKNCDALQIN